MWQNHPAILLLLLSSIISLTLAIFAWRRRSAAGVIPLVFLALGAALWQFGYAVELAWDNQSVKVVWGKFQYLGIASIPTAWFAVALQYAGLSKWLTRRNLALMAVVPAITLVLAWTNEAHGLIWSSITPDTSGDLFVLVFSHGAWFWFYTGYSYLLILSGMIAVANTLFFTPGIYVRQALAWLVSALTPWAANWLFSIGLTPLSNLNMTPFAFIISSLAVTWALFQAKLLDISPLARNTVFEEMTNGVLVIDKQDRIIDYNLAVKKIFRDSSSLAIGHIILEVWQDAVQIIRPAPDEQESLEFESNSNGEQHFHEVTSTPFYDNHGDVAGKVIIFSEITERKRVEEERIQHSRELEKAFNDLQDTQQQLIQAAKLAAIGELVSGIAHELNSPLASVSGMSQLIIRMDLDESLKKDVEAIHFEAERATKIVQNLLSFARNHRPEKRRGSVNEALGRILELRGYDRKKGDVELELNLQSDLPETWFDIYQMQQVFLNIIINAEQAMSETSAAGRLCITTLRVGEKIHISIADNGPGIPDENLHRIFDPFFTTKEVGEGTGLGLSLSYGIVQEHDGRLWVDSEVGKGSTFTVEIPITRE